MKTLDISTAKLFLGKTAKSETFPLFIRLI
jgi:hypothetical protein